MPAAQLNDGGQRSRKQTNVSLNGTITGVQEDRFLKNCNLVEDRRALRLCIPNVIVPAIGVS